MGVNTHLPYGNTPYYNNWPQVLSALQNLGIRHLRDGYFDPAWGPPLAERHQQLAQSNIHTDYTLPTNYFSGLTVQSVQQLASEVSDMEVVEFPNECDNAGSCGATAALSLSNMIAFGPTVDAAASALNLSVIGPSFAAAASYAKVGNLSSMMTYNNLHAYFAGRNPGNSGYGSFDSEGNSYGSIPYELDQANLDGPGLPVQITETGYISYPGTPQAGTIPEDTEESYIPRTFAMAYLSGIRRTYIYEFLDEVNSPGYGMVDSSLNPKPSYYAIQNLISNLADPGTSFTPGTLAYSVSGGGSTLKQLLLQKHDGSFWLLMWLEQSSFDPVNLVYTPVTPQSVTLTLGGSYYVSSVGTFNTAGSLNWTSTQTTGQTLTVSISDQISIVHIPAQ